MPNGSDCAAVLQTEAIRVPTQWFVLDATADGRAAGWLRADVPGEIDYLHARREPPAGGDAKAAYVAMRPALLHGLFDAYERRRGRGQQGAAGRVGRGRPGRTRWAGVCWPSGRWTWPTPCSGTPASSPPWLRVGVGGSEADRRSFLSHVRGQYFGLPDFSGPYYGRHTPGQLYGNEFDAVLLCPSDADAAAIVGHLVPLHIAETRFARAHLQRHSPGGMMVIEQVLAASSQWRKIDWFALTAYPYFRRLWDAPRDDLLAVLDYARCPARAQDPWAAIKGRSREKTWDDLDLGPADDLLAGDAAYRVTPGDHRTRRLLAGFLLSHRDHAEVLRQCDLARSEGGYDANDRWLRVEAFARLGTGDEDHGRPLLDQYRRRLGAVAEPSAKVLDEVGSLGLMASDWRLAFESARRAVGKDRFLGHAYDTMVIAGRESGNAAYEQEAADLARANGVTVPIHVREQTAKVMKTAKLVKLPEPPAPQRRKWWQVWR